MSSLAAHLITVAAAAQRLGVSPQWVRALVRAGQLRAERPGTEWLLVQSDVEARAAAQSDR